MKLIYVFPCAGDDALDNIPTTLSTAQSSARCRKNFETKAMMSETGSPLRNQREKTRLRQEKFRLKQVCH